MDLPQQVGRAWGQLVMVGGVEIADQRPGPGEVLAQRLVHHLLVPRKYRSVGVEKVQTYPLTPFSRQPVSSACTTGLPRIPGLFTLGLHPTDDPGVPTLKPVYDL